MQGAAEVRAAAVHDSAPMNHFPVPNPHLVRLSIDVGGHAAARPLVLVLQGRADWANNIPPSSPAAESTASGGKRRAACYSKYPSSQSNFHNWRHTSARLKRSATSAGTITVTSPPRAALHCWRGGNQRALASGWHSRW